MGEGCGATEVSGRMTHDTAAPSRALSRGRRGWGRSGCSPLAPAELRWATWHANAACTWLAGVKRQVLESSCSGQSPFWRRGEDPVSLASLGHSSKLRTRAIDGHFLWERGAKAFLTRGGCSPRGRAGERAGGALGPRARRAGLLGEVERCLLPWVPGDFFFWPYVKV